MADDDDLFDSLFKGNAAVPAAPVVNSTAVSKCESVKVALSSDDDEELDSHFSALAPKKKQNPRKRGRPNTTNAGQEPPGKRARKVGNTTAEVVDLSDDEVLITGSRAGKRLNAVEEKDEDSLEELLGATPAHVEMKPDDQLKLYSLRMSQVRTNQLLSELNSALAESVDDDVEAVEGPKTKVAVIFNVHELGKNGVRAIKLGAPLNHRFDKIIQWIAAAIGCEPEQMRLSYIKIPVNMQKTPADYNLADNDEIDVYISDQLPTVAVNGLTAVSENTDALLDWEVENEMRHELEQRERQRQAEQEEALRNQIVVKLRVQGSKEEIRVKMNKNDPISKLITAVADKVGASQNNVKLKFDGEKLSGSDTPADFEMENDDQIDVFLTNEGETAKRRR